MVDDERKTTKNERLLIEKFKMIKPVEKSCEEQAKRHWKTVAKPLFSLGKLEDAVIRMAGIRRKADFEIKKKGLLIFCADNGVVSEGVTQTGQEVTAIVAENFLSGDTSACVMSRQCGTKVIPVDIGMTVDTRVSTDLKVACGTANMTKEPAMTREQAVQALETGIEMVRRLKEDGYGLLATGEMGIGNTTTSSAVASVLLGDEPAEITGRGAGLTNEGLERKIHAIEKAIAVNRPKWDDPVDVLAKVGGFDLAGITGLYLGGAVYRIPIVVDGFISAVAALVAVRICEWVKDAMIVSHVSKEPGMQKILKELHMDAPLHADMCLGEGTGAVAYLPVLDLAAEVYGRMSTFSENDIEDYKELGEKE